MAGSAVVPAAAALVDAGHGSGCHVHAVKVALDGAVGISGDEQGLLLGVEAQQFHHHPGPPGDLSHQVPGGVI